MLAGRTEAPGVPPRLKKSRQRQPHASAGGGRGFRPIRLRRAAERARRIDCKAAVAANRSWLKAARSRLRGPPPTDGLWCGGATATCRSSLLEMSRHRSRERVGLRA